MCLNTAALTFFIFVSCTGSFFSLSISDSHFSDELSLRRYSMRKVVNTGEKGVQCHVTVSQSLTESLGHLLEKINILPSSFSECNGVDITSPVGHYSTEIINPSQGVCAHKCLYVLMCRNVHVHMYAPCDCMCFSEGFRCIV